MKPTAMIFALFLPISSGALAAGDDARSLFREAWKEYEREHYGEVTTRLRALLRLLEDETARQVAAIIPERIEDWSGGDPRREDLAPLGGGVSVERSYRLGAKEITVKVVRDSPVAEQLMKILGNDELVAWGGARVHNVQGVQAIMEGERKVMMVVREKIYLELRGDNDTGRADLLSLARKLDLRALKAMK